MRCSNYVASICHMLIITMFSLGLGACGFKADPYYQEKISIEDDDVTFIEKK